MSLTSPLLSLVQDPATMGRVIRVMTAIVARSFEEDQSRATQREGDRRCRMAIDLFRLMRAEGGYSVTRCLDELPVALRCKLDGAPWEPSKRRTWSTTEPGLPGVPVETYEVEDPDDDRDKVLWTPERARLGIV